MNDELITHHQKGFAPILLLIAGLGIIAFLGFSSFAPFRDKLLSTLYHTSESQASTDTPYINHILSTGQSLAGGADGCPVLTTTQPFSNLSITDSSNITMSTFAPLTENKIGSCHYYPNGIETQVAEVVEGMSSSLANTISNLSTNKDQQYSVGMHAVGGYEYVKLKKGTATFDKGLAQLRAAKQAAQVLGKPFQAIGVTAVHGESDSGFVVYTPGPVYEQYMEEWQRDYENESNAITGQTGTLPLFLTQFSSYTTYQLPTSEIPQAQLDAAELNPGQIYMVGPKYFLPYRPDGGAVSAHLTSQGYRWMGEYYGKVMKKVLVDKQDWKPLSPVSVFKDGVNHIYAKFHVPSGPLVFDTTSVAAKANMGFEYTEDGTDPAKIARVEIVSADTVHIELDRVPTHINGRLKYAWTGEIGSRPGYNQPGNPAVGGGSARGNLRDSDNTASLYGNKLYNWAVHFDRPVGWVAPLSRGQMNLTLVENGCRDNESYVELGWNDFSNLPSYDYVVSKREEPAGSFEKIVNLKSRNFGGRFLTNKNYSLRVVVVSDNKEVGRATLSLKTQSCGQPVSSPSPSISPSPSPSPVPFSLKPPVVYCLAPNTPRVHLAWNALQGILGDYTVLFRDQVNTKETAFGSTSGLALNFEKAQGLTSGHSYGFLIAGNTAAGAKYSDNLWSDRALGWTFVPACP